MKKIITTILTAGFASCLFAQGPVSSVNAAGFVKKTVDAGKLQMVQVPFEDFAGATRTVTDVLGTNVADQTLVYVWDTVGQTYLSEQFFAGFGWFPGTTTLDRGDGLFLASPVGSQNDVFLFGEVPDDAASTDITIVSGLQMIGYPYPTSIALTNSVLNIAPGNPGAVVADNDLIYKWDQDTGWESTQYFNGFGWFPATMEFEPGDAFFYYTAGGGGTWSETKPYVWP